MGDFVKHFPAIMPDIELPPGFPPQRVFAMLDVDKNRSLDPTEMKNMQADVRKMLADHTAGKPPPTAEEREAMKKAARERGVRGKDGGAWKGRAPPQPAEELDKTEFFKRAAQRSPGEDPHVVFARVDKDKSGGLSRDEMRDYYKDTAQAGQEYVKQRREQAKKAGPFGGKPKGPPDPDREIGFGEFERRYKSALRTETEPHGHHKKFIELDKDGNLKLSKQEMAMFLKEL